MRCVMLGLAVGLASIGCDGVGPPPPPLSAAARAGDLAAIRRELDGGADVNQRDERSTGWPPLMHAIHKRQLAAVQLLLTRGADPNLGTLRGYTPLMMAAADGDAAYVRALLAHGADPRRVGPTGETALGVALSGGALVDIDRPLLGGCHTETARAILAHDPGLKRADLGDAAWVRWWAGLQHCADALELRK